MATNTVRRRRLGIALREHRRAARVSMEDAAAVISVHKTTISRMERGQAATKPLFVQALLAHYSVDATESAVLVELAKEASKPGWWRSYVGVVDERHLDHIALESEASRISTWEPVLIPALLQTEDYARAVLQRAGVESLTHTQIEKRVQARAERKARLLSDNPPALAAIFDEGALRRPVGGRDVMCGQLEHLLELAQMPNIGVQLIPTSAGAHAGVTGSVTLLEYESDEDPPVAFLETVGGDLYLDEPGELKVCRAVFDALRSDALSASETEQRIAQLAAESELG
ncbi:helix-turn-helix domain-containing protein [Actinorhabdospora filicis]|nr:helix-turn-helix transcriptional regulator [Actinorhabdospora filicis]